MDIMCMECISTNMNQYFLLSKCTFSIISPHLTASQFFISLSIIKLLHIFHLLVKLRRTGPIGHLLFFFFFFYVFYKSHLLLLWRVVRGQLKYATLRATWNVIHDSNEILRYQKKYYNLHVFYDLSTIPRKHKYKGKLATSFQNRSLRPETQMSQITKSFGQFPRSKDSLW